VRLEGLRKLKNLNGLGNRIHDLPACSIVPQPTTLPRVYCDNCQLYNNVYNTAVRITEPMTVSVKVFMSLGPQCHAIPCY
jgi:hypothetical protein